MSVLIDYSLTEQPDKLAAIVERWGLISDDRAAFSLLISSGCLELRSRNESKMGAIKVNFSDTTLNYRRKHGGGRTEGIAKAVGIQGVYRPNVVDGTAGLGRDAFILASLGCNVTMVERNPLIAALLEDGLCRATQDPELLDWLPQNLKLIYGTSLQKFAELKQLAEVIYLDPMFPHRQKSALVKKEMQCFQQIVGADQDADGLLDEARKIAHCRVVVKRPIQAPFLADVIPSGSIKTKKHRFDLYSVLRD